MILHRILPLAGQVVLIADYQDLFNKQYRGQSAEWWYRTNSGGIKQDDGDYFLVEDWRGLFVRGAGQNSRYKAANNTPYNGGDIGEFTGDAIRNFTGGWANLPAVTSGASAWGACAWQQAGSIAAATNPISNGSANLNIDASRVVPTSHENRPASISAAVFMTY
jgi:hypothetical protein